MCSRIYQYKSYAFWAKVFWFHIESRPEWDSNPWPCAYGVHALTSEFSGWTIRCAEWSTGSKTTKFNSLLCDWEKYIYIYIGYIYIYMCVCIYIIYNMNIYIYIYIVGNIYVGNNKREWLRKKSNLVYTLLFAVLFAILISLCKVLF